MKIKRFVVGYRFRPGRVNEFSGHWSESSASSLRGAMTDCRRRFQNDPEVQPWFSLLVGVVDADGLGPWIVASAANKPGSRWTTHYKLITDQPITFDIV